MLVESYYHDQRYPICPYTLPQIYDRVCKDNTTTTIAWTGPYEKYTIHQIYEQAMEVARGLLAIGLKRGDTLCCIGSVGSDPVIMFYACSSLGIKYMSNFIYSPAKKVIRTVISKVKPTAVMVGTNKYTGMELEDIFAEFSSLLEELKSDPTEHTPSHVIYDRKAEKDPNCNTDIIGWRSLSQLMNEGVEKISEKQLEAAKSLPQRNEPCVYSMSSGSSGEPKFVLVNAATYASLTTNHPLGFGHTVRVFGMPDMAIEDFALYGQLIGVPTLKASLVIFPIPTDDDSEVIIQNLMKVIQENRVELFYYDQYFTTMMINKPELRKGYDLSSLKVICIAGSVSTADFKHRMLQIAPLSVDIYGCTECFQLTAVTPGLLNLRPTSVGQPVPNLEVKIVDDTGKLVPINERGQLCVRGEEFLFIEYKDQPELTAQTKGSDGWMLTGDQASMDELGYLYIYGRIASAQRWKVGSDVVYSAGIETVLRSHPKISACLVFGTQAEGSTGHHLCYVIVPVSDSGLTAEEVKKFSFEKMNSSIEWPVRIFFYNYEELPMTTGSRRKVNRQKLQEMVESRVERDGRDGLVWEGLDEFTP